MEFSIRQAAPADHGHWVTLWTTYCAALDTGLPDHVTQRTWQRIVSPSEPVHALIAFNAEGEPLGFCNYVCHPRTWSEALTCYLEDLYVTPLARRSGIATALINELRNIGQQRNWSRIYWITHANNVAAQAAYDRIADRKDYVRFEMALDV